MYRILVQIAVWNEIYIAIYHHNMRLFTDFEELQYDLTSFHLEKHKIYIYVFPLVTNKIDIMRIYMEIYSDSTRPLHFNAYLVIFICCGN